MILGKSIVLLLDNCIGQCTRPIGGIVLPDGNRRLLTAVTFKV